MPDWCRSSSAIPFVASVSHSRDETFPGIIRPCGTFQTAKQNVQRQFKASRDWCQGASVLVDWSLQRIAICLTPAAYFSWQAAVVIHVHTGPGSIVTTQYSYVKRRSFLYGFLSSSPPPSLVFSCLRVHLLRAILSEVCYQMYLLRRMLGTTTTTIQT
ncbi:hypothetical protein VTO42DRAFT_6224 [Malbranchea cinnamomea]